MGNLVEGLFIQNKLKIDLLITRDKQIPDSQYVAEQNFFETESHTALGEFSNSEKPLLKSERKLRQQTNWTITRYTVSGS